LQDDQGLALDDRTRIEMEEMGFFFVRHPERKGMAMISQEGDVVAITDQGLPMNCIWFGLQRKRREVEAGFIKKGDEQADGEKASGEKKDDEKADEKPNSKKIKSRYLFAQAQFTPEALGPKPEAPVRPEPPVEEAKSDSVMLINRPTPARQKMRRKNQIRKKPTKRRWRPMKRIQRSTKPT